MPKMPKQTLSKEAKLAKVLEYLHKNRLMALATSSVNKPWLATVFFAFDEGLVLYFFSREDSKHCKNIKKNPSVAVAVNHAWRNADGTIRGLQMPGRAEHVSEKEYSAAYALYKKRFRWADDFAFDHVLYRIKPIEIWYIDEQLFDHFNRVRVK